MAQKITVVNDDAQFLRLMELVLTDAGYDVLLLPEYGPAPKKIRDWMPDLVILDLRFENPTGGMEVLELLKGDRATAVVPVIICSADIEQVRAVEDRLHQVGCQTLLKPFDIEDLLAMVKDCIGPA